jgi:RNA polymerase sigma-70 factor, ECF subfamily
MIQTMVRTSRVGSFRYDDGAATDEALMARVARSDGRALAALYDRHCGAALGLAFKILRDRGSAEETVQEAFWRVWRNGNSYASGRGRFCAWLFGIVHHLAIDELRRRRTQPPVFSPDTDVRVLDMLTDHSDITADIFRKISGEEVRAALAALPDAQRSVIELAYFYGLTHREIAEKLHEPIGTIHTRARMGLLKLREAFVPIGSS